MNSALERLTQLPLGTRVVIRYRIGSGLTDALGDLVARDDLGCTVATRTGTLTIKFDDVQLAKAVPPPPPRRERRMQH
ncbi:putative acetyltransferase [Arthrobacter glacialis]|uniref:Ferrous iron transport protein A n=1 Tax=Arthrobacter glacialis TaxID=1664 RepID=A0A2S3ZQU0_ARTGL|nr:ferrous iron transport protein A [Arthrobacter glacialis]POH71595.1 ferrous iron transport protein A [Arthrobacter glacialis]